MQTPHERFEDEAMRLLSQGRVVVDVGGGQRFMKGMKRHEPLFAACRFFTVDSSRFFRPDVVGDIHRLPLATGAVDGVICRSVLEHVEQPWEACREIHRVLRPGGHAFFIVPSIYPDHARHGDGAYPDHWRFFESTMRLMLRGFSEVQIEKHGGWFQAMSNFLPFQARVRGVLDLLSHALDTALRTKQRRTTPLLSVLARK